MKYLFLLLTFLFLAGCQTTSPTLQTGTNAEITFDGLHRVDGSYMQYAWLKPDLNLAAYTKVRVVNAGIEYREVKPASRSPSANARRSEFPLTEISLFPSGSPVTPAKPETILDGSLKLPAYLPVSSTEKVLALTLAISFLTSPLFLVADISTVFKVVTLSVI